MSLLTAAEFIRAVTLGDYPDLTSVPDLTLDKVESRVPGNAAVKLTQEQHHALYVEAQQRVRFEQPREFVDELGRFSARHLFGARIVMA